MDARGKTVALLVAAGSGSRAGGLPKQYRRLGGRPLLALAAERLRHPRIDQVQAVIGAGQEDPYREAVGALPLPTPVLGGATRQQSVRNGLAALAGGGVGRVLIHDAARPFLPAAVIDRLLDALDDHDGAVPVLPVVDTLARRGEGLGEAVSRDDLVRVQTPQAFRFDDIARAHSAWTGGEATDDAQVARAVGLSIAAVDGDPGLEKLTYDEDFRRAEALIAGRSLPRTGFGFDVHAFGPGDSLWLGGVRIGHDKGLVGHSDADVLLHAITDALLLTQAAPAERPCITNEEAGDMAVALLPYLLDAAAQRCRPHLGANAFLLTGAAAWSARLRRDSVPRRASALRGISKMGGGAAPPSGAEGDAAFDFVAQLVTGGLTGSLRPEHCGQIDTIAQALSPLPTENIARLVGALAAIAVTANRANEDDDRDDRDDDNDSDDDEEGGDGPPICPA